MVGWARAGAAVFFGLILVSAVGPVAGQTTNSASRTFVSGTGTDTGLCTREKPCRTLAFAMGPTPVGGEIVALDQGDYAPVTITKALTITGPGKGTGGAKITGAASSGYAIEINASGAVVNLRGIEINGGANGIGVTRAASVDIADTVVTGATNTALTVQIGNVTVHDSTFQGSALNIQFLPPVFPPYTLVLKGVKALNASFQNVYGSQSLLVMEDCLIANTIRSGQAVQRGVGLFLDYKTTAVVKNSVIANSTGHGIYMGGAVTLTLDTTTVTGSGGYGIHYDGSGGGPTTVNSYGNNNIVGNTSGVSDITLTPVSTN